MASLISSALVALSVLKEELGITDSTNDNVLIRKINAATKQIEAYCDRGFVMEALTELYPVNLTRPVRLYLKRAPLITLVGVQSGALPGPGVAITDYDIEDAPAGILYRDSRWSPTNQLMPGVVKDYEPGTAKKSLQVQYLGGYLTQPQIDAAGAWAGASTSVSLGRLAIPAAHNTQVWMVTSATSSGSASLTGTTGGSEPTWGSSPALGDTKTDGNVTWTYMGSTTTAATVPDDLVQVVLDLASNLYLSRGQNSNIKSESLLSASVTYGDANERGTITAGMAAVLSEYRRIALG